MKHFSTIALSFLFAAPAFAQSECADGRYSDPAHFDSVTVTLAVPFGSNTPVTGGGTETLEMDIYEPYGDTLAERPAVIVAFGGSFIAGTRADVADLCIRLAKLGYVAVAPDYRVGFFFPNVNTTQLAVVRCMHDLRAAIRCLRKTVDLDGNPYGIDTHRIVVGGVSAGGIGAIHATYLNQSIEIPPTLYDDTLTIGAVEGNSGWPSYSSEVIGCWSMSGAIGDTSWIQAGDQPLCSIHETGDPTVPYGTQEVSVIGIATGLTASGSSDIHRRMDHVGVPNCFLSYTANQHVGYLSYDTDNSIAFVTDFLANVVCGNDANCGTIYAGVGEHPSSAPLRLSPNPTSGSFSFTCEERCSLMVLDVAGRTMLEWQTGPGTVAIDISQLPDGVYQVRCLGADVRTARIVKN
jgi:para-nitrobenzyl esterase